MTNRSNIVVPRSVRARTCRVYVFWSMAALCLPSTARPSRAAGCHVQDRPVLQSTLSWDTDQSVKLAKSPIVQPPPVLNHPPCEGETPLAVSSSTLPAAGALSEHLRVELPDFYEPTLARSRQERPHPPSPRLDRPPRLIHLGFNVKRPA